MLRAVGVHRTGGRLHQHDGGALALDDVAVQHRQVLAPMLISQVGAGFAHCLEVGEPVHGDVERTGEHGYSEVRPEGLHPEGCHDNEDHEESHCAHSK